MEENTINKGDIINLIAIALYNTIYLTILLKTGIYSDDMVSSLVRGHLGLTDQSILSYIFNVNYSNVVESNRFLPVGSFLMAIPYLMYNVVYYKIFMIVLVLVNVFAFGYLIFIISQNKKFSYIFMIIVPSFFQFRIFHDPILSFYGGFQIVFLLFILSLILLVRYIESYKKIHIVGSVILLNLGLYCYEIFIVFVPIYLLFILISELKIKEKVRVAIPACIFLGVAICLNIFIRIFIKTNNGYEGISFGTDVDLILKTIGRQVYAGIPSSYFVSDPSYVFGNKFNFMVNRFDNFCIAILFIFLILKILGKGWS